MNEPAFGGALPGTLKDSYAHYADEVEGPGELAALAGLTLAQVEAALADPRKVAELETHRAAQQKQGKLQPIRERKLLQQTLDVIQKHLDGDCDIDAALEIIKPLIRLTEIRERTRLAEREVDDTHKLTIIRFNIGRAAEKRIATGSADVIDVHAVQISQGGGGAL